MKNTAKALSIAIFLAFGLFTAVTSFPQGLNAAPPGNPPSANVSPTFTGLTVTGTTSLRGTISDPDSDVTIADGLNVSGYTTTLGTLNAGATTLSSGSVTGNLTTGGDLNVTGTSILGLLDLRGNLENTFQSCYGLYCLNNPIAINDSMTVSGNTLFSSNLTVNGNTTTKGNTTLGDAITDTVTINGTQKTTEDIKSDRFIRAKVDANGMGGIGRYYTKDYLPTIGAGGNFMYSLSCDGFDEAVSCNGGFLDNPNYGPNYIINGLYISAGSTCNIKGANFSSAAATITLQVKCFAPDENKIRVNGIWKILNYDGSITD